MSWSTKRPPIPMMMAIPTTPQNSTNGKYLVEIRTVSRLASYCASFVSRNRRGERTLAAERLHDPDSREAFLQRGEVVADPLAHLEVGAVRLAPEPARRERHRRHDDQDAQRELPAHDEDHDERPEEQQRVLDDRRETLSARAPASRRRRRSCARRDGRSSRARRSRGRGRAGGGTPGSAGPQERLADLARPGRSTARPKTNAPSAAAR